MTNGYNTALEVFEAIQSTFPELRTDLNRNPSDVDLAMNIPEQSGLDFPVELSFQNEDELHLIADVFWCEWFPCTDPEQAAAYAAAVNGLISGENRIEVHRRRDRPTKAILQKHQGNGWKPIATWSTVHLPLGKKTIEYIQNQRKTY